jgi:aquaglyceroporin related protein, other eukaryote
MNDKTNTNDKAVIPDTPPSTHHDEHIPQSQPHVPRQYRETTVDGQPAYMEHGALIDHKVPQEELVQSQPDLRWSRFRHTMREPFSEFFGVFILILFGDGVVAQVVLSDGVKGNYQSISWGWGIGVMLGVYASGISGA